MAQGQPSLEPLGPRARYGARAVLTASAVELSITGNLDMMTKSEHVSKATVRASRR